MSDVSVKLVQMRGQCSKLQSPHVMLTPFSRWQTDVLANIPYRISDRVMNDEVKGVLLIFDKYLWHFEQKFRSLLDCL